MRIEDVRCEKRISVRPEDNESEFQKPPRIQNQMLLMDTSFSFYQPTDTGSHCVIYESINLFLIRHKTVTIWEHSLQCISQKGGWKTEDAGKKIQEFSFPMIINCESNLKG